MAAEMVTLTCDGCGTVFERRASIDKVRMASGEQTRRYCSRACYDATGRRRMVTVVCDGCDRPFERPDFIDRRAQQVTPDGKAFCSGGCRRRGRLGLTTVTLTCGNCGNDFERDAGRQRGYERLAQGPRAGHPLRGPFCSAECRNKRRAGPRFETTCGTCGVAISKSASRYNTAAKAGQTRFYCSTLCSNGNPAHIKAGAGVTGVRLDLGHVCRSTWEANVCRVFRALGIGYEYEPHSFDLGGSRYIPDLLVAGSYWVEIKGYLRPATAEKLRRFQALFPGERLVIIDGPSYAAMEREWSSRIDGWEWTKRHRRPRTPGSEGEGGQLKSIMVDSGSPTRPRGCQLRP